MTPREYKTAAAFKQALEQRHRTASTSHLGLASLDHRRVGAEVDECELGPGDSVSHEVVVV